MTSLRTAATPEGMLDMLAGRPGAAAMAAAVPLLPIAPNGAGDAVAALFLFHLLQERGRAGALWRRPGAPSRGCCGGPMEAGAGRVLLVEAQEEFVRPGRWCHEPQPLP